MPPANVVTAWERLVRFHRAATTAMDQNLRAQCGHSLDDYDVLHQISAHGSPIRMGELAERLLVANSSCNRVVGRLVDAELITRLHGGTDRRNVLVELTPQGRRLRRRMAVIHTRDIERLFGSPLSTDELTHLDQALRMLLAAQASTAT
jgi:DNA-binding MarR family transcriptional regulator